jgi:histidinol-phosphatase (PHP family)
MTLAPVSIHGGHSSRFCNHAQDDLEALVRAYLRKGFLWVGLTEHMPPATDRFLYPEEKSAGLDAAQMRTRFAAYFSEARRLQRAYADRLEIFVGFETEATSGSFELALELANEHGPDYLVGGVHHVDDIPIDFDETTYGLAVQSAGGIGNLYCRYFDRQYEMIQQLKPAVVAHFDLIRIFDRDYRQRLELPEVRKRITRNLQQIAALDLILDLNVAALRKGAAEPYLSRQILEQALALGIAVVPADDAHGVDSVGACIDEGIALLESLGVTPPWRKPAFNSG